MYDKHDDDDQNYDHDNNYGDFKDVDDNDDKDYDYGSWYDDNDNFWLCSHMTFDYFN